MKPFKTTAATTSRPPNNANDKPPSDAANTTRSSSAMLLQSGITTAPSYTFYASRKILERSGFVLQTSRDVLEYLQTWLGVAYPLVKLGKHACSQLFLHYMLANYISPFVLYIYI